MAKKVVCINTKEEFTRDKVYRLVKKGLSFREAYRIVEVQYEASGERKRGKP